MATSSRSLTSRPSQPRPACTPAGRRGGPAARAGSGGRAVTTPAWPRSPSWSTTRPRSAPYQPHACISLSTVRGGHGGHRRLRGPGAGRDQPRLHQQRRGAAGAEVLPRARHHQRHPALAQLPQQVPGHEGGARPDATCHVSRVPAPGLRGHAAQLCRRRASVRRQVRGVRRGVHPQRPRQAHPLHQQEELRAGWVTALRMRGD